MQSSSSSATEEDATFKWTKNVWWFGLIVAFGGAAFTLPVHWYATADDNVGSLTVLQKNMPFIIGWCVVGIMALSTIGMFIITSSLDRVRRYCRNTQGVSAADRRSEENGMKTKFIILFIAQGLTFAAAVTAMVFAGVWWVDEHAADPASTATVATGLLFFGGIAMSLGTFATTVTSGVWWYISNDLCREKRSSVSRFLSRGQRERVERARAFQGPGALVYRHLA